MYAQEISASRFVELCLGVVVRSNNITRHTHTHAHARTHTHPPTHTHTYTHIILPQNFTNNFFLYNTRSSHAIF